MDFPYEKPLRCGFPVLFIPIPNQVIDHVQRSRRLGRVRASQSGESQPGAPSSVFFGDPMLSSSSRVSHGNSIFFAVRTRLS